MRLHWIVAVAAPGLLVASCARNSTESEVEKTTVRFVQDSVPLVVMPNVTSFQVTVVITNGGAQKVEFGGCGPAAQRSVGGQWQTVWTPTCLTPQSASIAPGDSLTLPIGVAGPTQPSSDLVSGTYRLSFGVWYSDSVNPTAPVQLEALNSPPFKVYQP
jgi:hypothetical protein